jgi:hypothetical protein
MSRLSSSTSSSEAAPEPKPVPPSAPIRDVLVIGVWMMATLAAIDVAINVFLPPPSDPNVRPSRLTSYFQYGRSIEGKIVRLIGTSDATAAQIASAGWRSAPPGPAQPTRPRPGSDLLLANYGMSFSEQVGDALAKIDPKLTVRSWGGPSAPPNCAYGYYLADRGRHDADVVMLGILSNRVAAMESTSGMNNSFEGPAPYSFPSFTPDGSGGITTIEPPFGTLGELRAALADADRRQALIEEMRRHDAYYAGYLFQRNVLDYSALARIVRRALAHRHDRAVESRSYTEAGFVAESIPVKALRLMVKAFARSVRGDGRLPVVLLLHTRGYADHLYAVLADDLATDDIPYVSTHTICPASDSTNYVADGHFTPEANGRIAQALADVLAARLPGRGNARRSRVGHTSPRSPAFAAISMPLHSTGTADFCGRTTTSLPGDIRGTKLRVLPFASQGKAHLGKGKKHSQQVIHGP